MLKNRYDLLTILIFLLTFQATEKYYDSPVIILYYILI